MSSAAALLSRYFVVTLSFSVIAFTSSSVLLVSMPFNARCRPDYFALSLYSYCESLSKSTTRSSRCFGVCRFCYPLPRRCRFVASPRESLRSLWEGKSYSTAFVCRSSLPYTGVAFRDISSLRFEYSPSRRLFYFIKDVRVQQESFLKSQFKYSYSKGTTVETRDKTHT